MTIESGTPGPVSIPPKRRSGRGSTRSTSLDLGGHELRRRHGLDDRRRPSPSIEDVVLGLVPGLPKVHLHNKVLAYETGEEFLAPFRRPPAASSTPFVLVVEGSIPNEKIKGDGYWTPSATTRRPASRSPSTGGSTGSRPGPGRSSRSAPARPTAASTRWRATPPAAWGSRTISAGTSGRGRACRS